MNADLKPTKIAFNGNVYHFRGDSGPIQNSGNFIESNAVFELYSRISPFVDKSIATSVSNPFNLIDELNNDNTLWSGKTLVSAFSNLRNTGNYCLVYYNTANQSLYQRTQLKGTSMSVLSFPTVMWVLDESLGTFNKGTSCSFTLNIDASANYVKDNIKAGDRVLDMSTSGTSTWPIKRILNVSSVSGREITFSSSIKTILGDHVMCFDKTSRKLFELDNGSLVYLTDCLITT